MVYKQDEEKARERVEAWWNGAVLDRACIQARAPREGGERQHVNGGQAAPSAPMTQAELERWFLDPEVVMPRVKADLAGSYFGGEAMPVLYPVSINLVAVLANILGCPLRYVDTQTTWHVPVLEDWASRPRYAYDPDNPLWQRCRALLERAAAETDGWHVGIPDLNGATQVIALLRGDGRFALDFHDHPEEILPAVAEINEAWRGYWAEADAIASRAGGHFFWMGFWSERPAVDLQSDFCCMISPADFRRHFLPSLEEQTRMVERTIFHLDGSGAVRHVDALLELPGLTGIQWIQGAGGGPVTRYLPLLQRIQDAGKLVSCFCRLEDLAPVMQALRPEGVHLVMEDLASPAEAEEAVRRVLTWTRRMP